MKRTGFKKPTYEEAIAKAKIAQARRAERATKKPKRSPKRKVKRNKDGSLAKSERVRILKTKLWKVFSQYIRLSYADHSGFVVTCDGKYVHWKECDCGHLWHNSDRNSNLGGNELWWYENNFAPQSNEGNRNNADDSAKKYTLWAINRYGKDEVDKMYKMKQTYRLWTEEEVQQKYDYYKKRVDMMI